mmetsp:Transcript_22522/g.64835  ORF Transcript_22522/g.64835 Transcript_22522/m.64835 type:complete len:244 (+) Transcript_22522:618-1349(+)
MWPCVSVAPSQGVPGPNKPCPTAQTNMPSSKRRRPYQGKGKNFNVWPSDGQARNTATSKEPSWMCKISASNSASTKQPSLSSAVARPRHRGGGMGIVGVSTFLPEGGVLSTQERPVMRCAHVITWPSSETTTPDAQLPDDSSHNRTTPCRAIRATSARAGSARRTRPGRSNIGACMRPAARAKRVVSSFVKACLQEASPEQTAKASAGNGMPIENATASPERLCNVGATHATTRPRPRAPPGT